MDQHLIITFVIFMGAFFLGSALLHEFSKRTSFPYTVSLLIAGFATQLLAKTLQLHLPLTLSHDLIYFIILPLLLFEAAMHINFHQFYLQFKTITFLATFGLMPSILIVGTGTAWLVGLPLGVALLFGALISATDPIAVLALFKSLGAPKRLGLLADGESMFNDATAVIAFRIISALVLTEESFHYKTILEGTFDFTYVFIGSIIAGLSAGIIIAHLIAKINEDRLVENSLTVALALGAFIISEHWLHLSGVITTVIAGITLGNYGKTKFSNSVTHFIEEFWEYIGFFAVSLVFFFAAFSLDLFAVLEPGFRLIPIIIIVLVARAVSTYGTFFITNRFSFFKDEPNVPMSWQHIINWGGLRGVIPLVLVYSLPETFYYRNELLSYTLTALLFTLFVNGLTIKKLLLKLNLHIPSKDEIIIKEEQTLLNLEAANQRLNQLSDSQFDSRIIGTIAKELQEAENLHKQKLRSLITPEELSHSLELYALEIERLTAEALFRHNQISESILGEYHGELDLQQDALEFPEVYEGRGYQPGGIIQSDMSFRRRLRYLKNHLVGSKILSRLFGYNQEQLIEERLGILQARLVSGHNVIEFMDRVSNWLAEKPSSIKVIRAIQAKYQKLIKHNQKQFQLLAKEHPQILERFQQHLVYSLVWETGL